MPSPQHEALHQIAREHPDAVEYALRRVHGIKIPHIRGTEIVNVDLTTIEVVERRVDSMIFLDTDEGPLALLFEAQLDHEPLKRNRWPFYVAYAHDRYDCPVLLVVLCRDARKARAIEEPITVGVAGFTCQTTRALVFGPHNVPRITEPEEAGADVVFTMLSALIHGLSADVGAILEVLAEALDEIDPKTAAEYAEFTEAGLGESEARQIWKMLMTSKTFPYVAEQRALGIAEGEAKGEARGEAKAVLIVLEARGISVPEKTRERIKACADLETLATWLSRAIQVTSADEIFG